MTGYRECFEQAVAAAIAGSTVLTENTRSARAIRAAAEERVQASCSAWLTPIAIPYGAFIEQLYSDAVVAGVVTAQALQREQELELWRQIIQRSSSGKELLLPESAAVLASESFRTAMEHDIALDSPQMSASSDTRAFSGWVAEFRHKLATNNWTCPALFANELAPCLSSLQLPEKIFVFTAESTPARQSFLEAIAEAEVQIAFASADEEENSLSPIRYEFDGIDDELRGAAQWARQQIEASPKARVGVVLFDLDRKLPQVESAFRSVLHPEQMLGHQTPTAFEIASPLALSEYPAVHCALQLLSFVAVPMEFHAFQGLLSSPYLALDSEETAKFLATVRKHAPRQVSFEDLAGWLQDFDVVGLRAALEALPKHSAFSSDQLPAYWTDISKRILKAFGWPGSHTLNSVEFQCTESWRDVLASVASLELLEWRTDFQSFVARLERTTEGRPFKPETLDAPVQIMDCAESEGSVFDALWIGSCSDELWPDSPRLSPLLPFALLKEAELPLVGSPEAAERISDTTSRLLQSAPLVALSLALRTDDEREQRWTPLFAHFEMAEESVELPVRLTDRFERASLDAISDSMAPALLPGESVRGGTSLLQEQSGCPFSAFAIRRLRAKESEGPNEALAPTDRGKVVDRALQLIWEELKNSEGLQRPDRAAVVEAAVDAAMKQELPLTSDPWAVRFRELERKRTVDVLTEWLALESMRKPFHVVGHQLEVEVNLGGLSLKGRLDRLDEIDDSHVVIDYKTGGSNAVSAWQVPRPRMPQLPFYALAMQQQKFDLAGLSFAIVRKGDVGFRGYLRDKGSLPCTDPTNRVFDGIGFDEYTERWADELGRIAKSFVQGDAAVDPKTSYGKSGSPCEHCHLMSLCRVGELATGDLDGEAWGEIDE